MATYIEAFDNLTPDELDLGCREATRTAEQFPKPGHIRKALEASRASEAFLGPRQLTYPAVSQEERDAALKLSDELRKTLAPVTRKAETGKRITVRPSTLSIDEQKRKLRERGFLQ